jgi:OmpA-OmpF porin, OOP family
MTTLISGRTREQYAAWNRWHAIIAALLALLLLLLWFMGKGPGFANAGGSCCGVAVPAVAGPVVAPSVAPEVAPSVASAECADADNDGVCDTADRCPNTTAGERVGPYGCSCDITVRTHFASDSAELTAEDMATLDGVATRLLELEFEEGTATGHTDDAGDEAYNLNLSERRARAVVDYLAARGVASGRMTAIGMGETKPLADNSTEEGRAENRRVTIRRTDCGPAN